MRLISFWAIGEKPTGSRDPSRCAARRSGVIRIVVENKHPPAAAKPFVKADDLLAFFAERLKVQMREKGVRHDIVDAVLALGSEDDLVRLLARVEAVAVVPQHGGGQEFAHRLRPRCQHRSR